MDSNETVDRTGTGRLPFDRKLFRQRPVLDSMRLYIDVNDPFVTDLHSSGLLNDEELELIMNLSWPSNRNELLQLLIRKKWTSAMFDSFCDALRRNSTLTGSSDSNGVLADKLRQAAAMQIDNGRLKSMNGPNGVSSQTSPRSKHPSHGVNTPCIKGRQFALPDITPTSSSSSRSTSSGEDCRQQPEPPSMVDSLDTLLEPLAMSSRCTVRKMIRDRDDRIARLKADKDLLRSEARRRTGELEDARMRIHLTDQTFSDWLAALPMVWVSSPKVPSPISDPTLSSTASSSADSESLVASLEAIRMTLFGQSACIAQLEAENNQFRSDLRRVNGHRDQVEAVQSRLELERSSLAGQLEAAKVESDKIRVENESLSKRLQEAERQLASYVDGRQTTCVTPGESSNDTGKNGRNEGQKSKELITNSTRSQTTSFNVRHQSNGSRTNADSQTAVDGKVGTSNTVVNRNRKISAVVMSAASRDAMTTPRRVSDTSAPSVGRGRRLSVIDSPSALTDGGNGNVERRSGTSVTAKSNATAAGHSRTSSMATGSSTSRQDEVTRKSSTGNPTTSTS